MCDSRESRSDPGKVFYAHWDHENDRREYLTDHLQAVANLAGRFAEVFGAKDLGYLAGLWHDVGKFSRAFQEYIRSVDGTNAHIEGKGKIDHSIAGAVKAVRDWESTNPVMARILAYCIGGHHAGLADWDTDSDGSLKRRLARNKPETADALQAEKIVPSAVLIPQTMPPIQQGENPAFQIAFITRMLFSCLTDADFLSTEVFMDSQRTAQRENKTPSWDVLAETLQHFLEHKQEAVKPSPVNDRRREVLHSCLERASDPPGYFSLTVPTGGGKTFSSLAFAFRHAKHHGMSRIIYAIPFTSIIEQNAAAFRQALGGWADKTVLEHHSNFDPRNETP
ncbi:MAG: CRISPR-associated endonuclease Cas3'', partial [Phycisphaerae bacterium]|nr:CRISPR-associated endonuclease Cas3'' [Phycisphaerae bacterium]